MKLPLRPQQSMCHARKSAVIRALLTKKTHRKLRDALPWGGNKGIALARRKQGSTYCLESVRTSKSRYALSHPSLFPRKRGEAGRSRIRLRHKTYERRERRASQVARRASAVFLVGTSLVRTASRVIDNKLALTESGYAAYAARISIKSDVYI